MADENINLANSFKGGRTNPEESLDDMDFDEFEFDSGIDNNDRSPVEKAMSGAREGVWDMVEDDYVTQADRLTSLTLPKKMEVEREKLSDMFHEKDKEFGKITNELKGDAVTLGNAINSFLPEGRAKNMLSGLKDKIGWTDPSQKRGKTEEENHDNDVANQINEMFGKTIEADNRRHIEADAKADVKDKMAESRDDMTKELLLGIKEATNSSFKYTTEITANYQRKTLELSFKQVFLAKESLKKSQGYYETSTKLLQAIGKNTALPEFVKLRGGEILHQQGLQRFTQAAISSVSGKESYLQKKARNVRDWGLDKLTKLRGGTEQAAGAADMASGMGDMITVQSLAAEGAKKGAMMGAKWSRDKLAGRNGGDNGFNRILSKLYDTIADAPYKMEASVNARRDAIRQREANAFHGYETEDVSSMYEDPDPAPETGSKFTPSRMFKAAKGAVRNGALGKTKSWLHDKLAVNLYEAFNFDKKDHTLDLTKDVTYEFDKRFYTSVTDVIPGYLSKILQTIMSVRSGQDEDPLTYNHGTNEFINTREMKSNLRKEVEDDVNIDRYRIAVDKVIEDEFSDFVGDDETKRARMRDVFYKQAELHQKKGEGMQTYDDIIRSGALNAETDGDIIELLTGKQAEERAKGWDDGKFAALGELEEAIPNIQGLAEAYNGAYGKTGIEGAGLFEITGNNVSIAEGSVVDLFNQRQSGEVTAERQLEYLIKSVKAPKDDLERAKIALESRNPIEIMEWTKYLKGVLYGDPVEMPSDQRPEFVGPVDDRGIVRTVRDKASGLAERLGLRERAEKLDETYGVTDKAKEIADALALRDRMSQVDGSLGISAKVSFLDKKFGVSAKVRAYEDKHGYGGKLREYKDGLMKKLPQLTAEEAEELVMDAFDRYGDTSPQKIVDTLAATGQTIVNYKLGAGVSKLFKNVSDVAGDKFGDVADHTRDILEVTRSGDDSEAAKDRIRERYGNDERVAKAIEKLEGTLKNVHGIGTNETVDIDPNDPLKGKSFTARLAATIGGFFKKKDPEFNDVDGDGDRDNGWRDLLSRRNENGESRSMLDRVKGIGKRGAGMAGGLLGGLLGKLMGGIPGGGMLLGAGMTVAKFAGKAALGAGKFALKGIARMIGPRLLPLGPAGALIGGALLLYSFMDDIQDFFSGGISGMIEKTDDALTEGVKGIDKLIDKFKWKVMDGLKSVKAGVASIANTIDDERISIGEDIGAAVFDGVQGVKDWWNSDSTIVETAVKAAKAVGTTVADTAKDVDAYLNNGESLLEKVTDIAGRLNPIMGIIKNLDGRRREGQDASTFLRMLQYGIPLSAQSSVLVERIKHAERILLVNGGLKRNGGTWKFHPSLLLLDGIWQVLNMGEYTDEKEDKVAEWVVGRFVPVLIAHLDAKSSTALKPGFTKHHAVPDGMHKPYLEEMLKNMAKYPKAYKVAINPFSHRGVDTLVTDSDLIGEFAEKTIASYVKEDTSTTDPDSRGILNKIFKDAHASTLTTAQKTQLSAKLGPSTSPATQKMVTNDGSPVGLVEKVSNLTKNVRKQRLTPVGNLEGLKVTSSERSITNLNPKVRQALIEMGNEYEALTGKKLQVNSGWRSKKGQAGVRDRNPDTSAVKMSMHELGFAIDIPQKQVDELMELGILNQFGFNRPLDSGRERHHIEPTVLMGHLDHFKRNPDLMTTAFDHGRGVYSAGLGEGKEEHLYKSGPKKGKPIITRDSVAAISMERLQSPVPKGIGAITVTPGAQGPELVGPRRPGASSEMAQTKSLVNSLTSSTSGKLNGREKDRKVLDIIDAAADKYGVKRDTLRLIMAQESSLNPLIKNDGSTATGLGQATDIMWKDWRNYKDSRAYSDNRKDPVENAMASAWYISNYSKSIKKEVPNFEGNPVYSYLITLLGAGNGPAFIRRLSKTPDAPVSDLLKPSVIWGNKAYFAPQGKIVSFREAFAIISGKLKGTAKDFSLNHSGNTSPAAVIASAAASTSVGRSENDAAVDSIEPRSVTKAREIAAVAPSRNIRQTPQQIVVKSPDEVKINPEAFNLVEQETRRTGDNTGRTNELLLELIQKLDANAAAEASREVVKPKTPPLAQAFNVRNPA